MAILDRGGGKILSEEVTVETSLNISAKIWGKGLLGRMHSSCRGPERIMRSAHSSRTKARVIKLCE